MVGRNAVSTHSPSLIFYQRESLSRRGCGRPSIYPPAQRNGLVEFDNPISPPAKIAASLP